MCKVVHFKKDDYDIYIGRLPNNEHNKWEYPKVLRDTFSDDTPRDVIVSAYEDYLLSNEELLKYLFELKYKTLGCWCKNKGDKPNNHKLGVISESETTNDGFRYPSTVQFFQQKWRRQDQLHSTQKPVELIEWLINSYSNEGDTILDNTFGSCTTGIACINTNRNFIGIENDEKHFNISLKRVEEKRKEKEFNVVTSFGDGM